MTTELERLRAVLAALTSKLRECDQIISGMTLRCYGPHGYKGPTYGGELEAAESALADVPAPEPVHPVILPDDVLGTQGYIWARNKLRDELAPSPSGFEAHAAEVRTAIAAEHEDTKPVSAGLLYRVLDAPEPRPDVGQDELYHECPKCGEQFVDAALSRARDLIAELSAAHTGNHDAWVDTHAKALQRIAELEAALDARDKDKVRLHGLLKLHHSDAMELWAALKDLSFECDGVISRCNAPSVKTYNRTFAVLQKHEQGYSESARANPAGQAALGDAAQQEPGERKV